MLRSSDDAPKLLAQGRSILGPGWKEVDNFEDLSDFDEYESDEEEEYVVMDLGTAVDGKVLQTDNSYQLIGLDTPIPFLKLGNQIYQGQQSTLIGDEVILGLIRNQERPHNPSRPPIHSTSTRLVFRPITIEGSPPPQPQSSPITVKKEPDARRASSSSRPPRPLSIETDQPPQTVPTTPGSISIEPLSIAASPAISANESSSARGDSGQVINPKAALRKPWKKGEGGGKRTKHHTKIYINTIAEFEAFNPEEYNTYSTRIELAPEIQTWLGIEMTPARALSILKLGYTPKEIGKIKAGKPISGKGSRKPRRKHPVAPSTAKGKDNGKGKSKAVQEESESSSDIPSELLDELEDEDGENNTPDTGMLGRVDAREEVTESRSDGMTKGRATVTGGPPHTSHHPTNAARDVQMSEDIVYEERGYGEIEDEPLQEI